MLGVLAPSIRVLINQSVTHLLSGTPLNEEVWIPTSWFYVARFKGIWRSGDRGVMFYHRVGSPSLGARVIAHPHPSGWMLASIG